MAAVNFSSSGFSYAQAAKGATSAATSQTPSSKVTSGTASPATGVLSELTPGSNWADDVEASVGEKTGDPQKSRQEDMKTSQPKETAVDRAKSEEKAQNGISNVSSPDLAASSSTTTNQDDASSARNGSSSETTWENKSQTSEPAWIAEREKRQTTSQVNDKPAKSEKKSSNKEQANATPPKPIVLQDAPPPMVNPWTKRAEENKAKLNALPKATVTSAVVDTSNLKENARPRADSRRKANSIAAIPRELLSSTGDENKKPSGFQNRRANDVRNGSRQILGPTTDDSRSYSPLAGIGNGTSAERQSSLPNLTSAASSAKDDISWPTPDSAQEKPRKDTTEKETEEKRDDDATPTTKRKKPEWKVIPVVPNVIWETQSMNEPKKSRGMPNGERGSRGGARGRGGYRGTPNGTNAVDRQASRSSTSPATQDGDSSVDPRGRLNTTEGENAATPAAKSSRAASANSWRERGSEPFADHGARGLSLNEKGDAETSTADTGKPTIARASFARSFPERTQSPKKMNATLSDAKDDDFIPKPIPRRNSSGTQTEEATKRNEDTNRERPPIRMVPSDGRKERGNQDTFREPGWNGAPRGGKRNGRGRGGNSVRDLTNGHPSNHTYGNNFGQDYGAYAVPPSPSFQPPRGNHQYSYPPPGRGAWSSRTNPRSQSIPIDSSFYNHRYPGPYSATQASIPPIQTYAPGMMDMNGYPMTAIPFSHEAHQTHLVNLVITQLEYYFSIDNLLKDMFLRKHMDSQGFVFLDIITNFNRVRQLTFDTDIVKMACIESRTIEFRVGEDGKERIRKADGWEQFLLPMDQREESARTPGPERLELPERPQLSFSGMQAVHYRNGPASAVTPGTQQSDRRSYDAIYPMMNGVQAHFSPYGGVGEAMYGEATNGEEMRGRAAKSPIHENTTSPVEQQVTNAGDTNDSEPDSFPDDQISILTVLVKMDNGTQQRTPYHSAASRTFSNGSIDSRSIMAEMAKSAEGKSQSLSNGENVLNGSEPQLTIPRRASPNSAAASSTADRDSAAPERIVMWNKEKDAPMDDFPPNATHEPYVQLRLKALDQRQQASTGNCPYDLDVLYQFWCHFLIRNFNKRMYTEFKYYATADATERHNLTGLQNLVRYYAQALSSHNPIRERVVKDYVELVKNEPPKLEGVAFTELRRAWRDGALNLKNRKKLADILDDGLKQRLET